MLDLPAPVYPTSAVTLPGLHREGHFVENGPGGVGVRERHRLEGDGPVETGAHLRVRAFFREDGLVERLAQSPPRHPHVEERVVDGCELLERSGGGGGEQRHRSRGTDAEVLPEHEVARLVEHERGGHRAQELDDRGVRVLQGDRPPARAASLPARFHELLGLDRVRTEVTDLVAGAEVLLELPGDHTELVARPRQRAVRERKLSDGEDDDEPDEPEHHREDARRHDHDRAERDDGDHELARRTGTPVVPRTSGSGRGRRPHAWRHRPGARGRSSSRPTCSSGRRRDGGARRSGSG